MKSSTRALLILGAPLLGLTALGLAPRKVDLLIANPGRHPLEVCVSGLPPLTIEPGVGQRLAVSAGAHLLEVRGVGQPTTRVEAWLGRSLTEPRPTWVWSIAPVESGFYFVTRGYGDQESAPRRAEPWTPPAPVFRLPARDGGLGVIARVDEDFPDDVSRLPGETTGTVRKLLCTGARLDRIAPRRAAFIVGNPLGSPLRVSLGAREVGVVAPHGVIEVPGLGAGLVQAEALELGPQGQPGRSWRIDAQLELNEYFAPDAAWVWNVGGLTDRYVVVRRLYGMPEDTPAPPAALVRFDRPVVRLPTEWAPHLDHPFPERSRRGTLTMLWTYDHFLRERFNAQLERMQLEPAEIDPERFGPPKDAQPVLPPPEDEPPAAPPEGDGTDAFPPVRAEKAR